jgi:hypothetical protein
MRPLVNRYEALTHDALKPVLDRFDLSIYPKVRVADVIEPDDHGLVGQLKSYALKAHFDFLICKDRWTPTYAIEFDGPLHASAVQAARDVQKDELCRLADLPILRVHAAHLTKFYTDLTLLGWLVEVAEMGAAFDSAQAAGQISWDEDFDPFLMMSLEPGEPRFPYWISGEARVRLQSLHRQGKLQDPIASGFFGRDQNDVYHGAELIAVSPTEGLFVKAAMRDQNFPAPFGELLSEILSVQLGAKVDDWLRTGRGAEPLAAIYARASAMRAGLRMAGSHSCGDVTDLWHAEDQAARARDR